ncbi:MAG: hypothetical protein ACJ735_15310 [Actinomycetes bacterium]
MSISAGSDRRTNGPAIALGAVAVVYLLLELIVVRLHWGISYDESVYLSQVTPGSPPLNWHAWRALGTPVVIAPVALFRPNIVAIRLYTDLVSALGLVVAFWPWLRVLRTAVVALAALLFATCWVTIYFGNDVQPNMYVALAAVAFVGWFVRACAEIDPSRHAMVGLVVSGFCLTFLRPSDGVFVGVALCLYCLLRADLRRRRALVAGVLGALVLGWLPWVIEAFVRFGNPVHRYRLANASDAVGGFHLGWRTAGIYLRLVDGPYYGFPAAAKAAGPVRGTAVLFVVVLIVVAVVGRLTATEPTAGRAISVATAAGGALAVFYVFLLGYGAVRFLLPVFALLALPVAAGVVWFVEGTPRRLRSVAVLIALVFVAGVVTTQVTTASRLVRHDRVGRGYPQTMAHELKTDGLRGRCMLIGTVDIGGVSYWARCQAGGPVPDLVSAVRDARSQYPSVVLITTSRRLPAYFNSWREVRLSVANGRYRAWFPPASGT